MQAFLQQVQAEMGGGGEGRDWDGEGEEDEEESEDEEMSSEQLLEKLQRLEVWEEGWRGGGVEGLYDFA